MGRGVQITCQIIGAKHSRADEDRRLQVFFWGVCILLTISRCIPVFFTPQYPGRDPLSEPEASHQNHV